MHKNRFRINGLINRIGIVCTRLKLLIILLLDKPATFVQLNKDTFELLFLSFFLSSIECKHRDDRVAMLCFCLFHNKTNWCDLTSNPYQFDSTRYTERVSVFVHVCVLRLDNKCQD